MKNRNRVLALLTLALLVASEPALAQRRGGGSRGGGSRGGGMRGGGGGMRGGGMPRASARPSVTSRGGGGFGGSRPNISQGNIGSRPGGASPAINRGNVGSNVNRGDVGRAASNRNLSASDVSGIRGGNTINNRPIVGNDINIDGGWNNGGWNGGYNGCCYHPIATGVGIAAGAAIVGAAIGSTVYSLPSDCVVTSVNGVTYQQCGSTWYQPQFEGTNTTYVVVSPP